jgi:hypothetical protein
MPATRALVSDAVAKRERITLGSPRPSLDIVTNAPCRDHLTATD